ncbi:hypothetical protein GCM10027053_12670 [Intrasporangium mesophilum]
MEPGTVTVIVVGYNHARYVRECLDSIRAQTVPPDRVLVADDASHDDSVEVISGYLSEHPGFAAFYPAVENIGLTKTLNAMLAMVETEFVTYIAADDLMRPDRIAKHLAAMCGADLAYSDAEVIDHEGRRTYASSKVEFPWPDEPARSERILECLLDANWIPAASIFLRTAVLVAAGKYADHLFYEDFELLARLASLGCRFTYVDEPLVTVRRLETSLGAVGFDGVSPRFLVAMDAALRHYHRAPGQVARRALETRWALAKRASGTDLSLASRLAMLWAARGGARSRAAFLAHLGWTLRPKLRSSERSVPPAP